MNAVTRWKTIATIAVAFSAGNLFATACQNAGGGKANAEDGTTGGGDGSTPPPDLADVERDIASIKCFIGHMSDDQYWYASLYSDGRDESEWRTMSNDHTDEGVRGWNQGPNSDAMKAYEDCF